MLVSTNNIPEQNCLSRLTTGRQSQFIALFTDLNNKKKPSFEAGY